MPNYTMRRRCYLTDLYTGSVKKCWWFFKIISISAKNCIVFLLSRWWTDSVKAWVTTWAAWGLGPMYGIRRHNFLHQKWLNMISQKITGWFCIKVYFTSTDVAWRHTLYVLSSLQVLQCTLPNETRNSSSQSFFSYHCYCTVYSDITLNKNLL